MRKLLKAIGGLIWLKVILKYYPLIHLLVPAIESFPNEYYGILFGDKTSRSSGNERFIPEIVLPSLTAKRSKSEVNYDHETDRFIAGIVSLMCDSKHIGDFHSHTIEGNKKGRCLESVLSSLEEKMRISRTDFRSMEKNRNKLYLITGLLRNNRYFAPRITESGNLFGTIDGFNFMIAGYVWDSKKHLFDNARIECTYVTGMKGIRKQPLSQE